MATNAIFFRAGSSWRTLSKYARIRGERRPPCRPDHIRSDNGAEFTAQAVREWLMKVGVKTLFIEPGSPWENGYVESFNARFRLECLDQSWFLSLEDARRKIETWRVDYNEERPHSALGNLATNEFARIGQATEAS